MFMSMGVPEVMVVAVPMVTRALVRKVEGAAPEILQQTLLALEASAESEEVQQTVESQHWTAVPVAPMMGKVVVAWPLTTATREQMVDIVLWLRRM